MIESRILRLFDSPIVGLISWYLIVYKELTAGQIAKLAKKNVSTITRNLGKMKEAELVQITRIKTVKNLRVKYWRINPKLVEGDIIINRSYLDNLPQNEQKKLLVQVQNILLTFRGIIHAIIDNKISKFQSIEEIKDEGFMQLSLLEKEIGKSYKKQIKDLNKKFIEENQPDPTNLDNIDLDSYIVFTSITLVRDIVPPID